MQSNFLFYTATTVPSSPRSSKPTAAIPDQLLQFHVQPFLFSLTFVFVFFYNLITAVDHQVSRDSNRRLCGVQLQIEMERKVVSKFNPKNIELGLGGGEDERAE